MNTDTLPKGLSLIAKDISKSYGDKKIIDGVSLEIPASQNCVIMGPSGTGKSVFLKCLMGFSKPDHGSVFWNHENLYATRNSSQRFMPHCGIVFQSSALFDHLTLWENVAFGQTAHPMRWAESRAKDLLTTLGIPQEHHGKFPHQASGGMQRRVALGRALIKKPLVLFLDEPTAGLDPVTSESITLLIRKIALSLKITIVMVTHDLKSASLLGHQIVFLEEGKLLWQGSYDQGWESTQPSVRRFFKSAALKQHVS